MLAAPIRFRSRREASLREKIMAKRLKPPANIYVVFDPYVNPQEEFGGRDAAIIGVWTKLEDANAARQAEEKVLHYAFSEEVDSEDL